MNAAGEPAGASRGWIGYRIAALAGFASFVVGLAGAMLSDYGAAGLNPGTSVETTARYFAEHVGEAKAGAGLTATAALLTLVFAGVLWARLGSWPGVMAAASACLLAVSWWSAAESLTVAVTAGEYGDGQTARTLVTEGWETARLLGVPVLGMVVATLVAASRDRNAFPRWFRWVTAAFLVPLVVALVPAVGPSGGLAVIGSMWVPLASVLFVVERERGPD